MTATRIRCDQCEVLAINGAACHELGCPNTHIDPATGDPYRVECDWCGSPCFRLPSGNRAFCDAGCRESYSGE